MAPGIAAGETREVIDGKKRLAFPAVVDAHTDAGIYSPLAGDARNESRAAAMSGTTTMLNYMRTGQYYMNKGGPYETFFPMVLETSEGNFHVDYAYPLAPINAVHIDELEMLIERF